MSEINISNWQERSKRETQFMSDIGHIVVIALREDVRPEFVIAVLKFHASTIEQIETSESIRHGN